MFLFLLLLPALWVGLIPLFFATPLYTVQELLCLCKVTFLASPISVRQPQHLPPKQPLLSPPIWHTLSLASCVETGTVTCWSSFHFHTSNSAVNTLPLEANNSTFICLSSSMDKASCWIIVNNKCPSCSKITFTKTGNESFCSFWEFFLWESISLAVVLWTGNHCMKGNLQQEVNLLNPQSYNNKSLPYIRKKGTFRGFVSLLILALFFGRLVCVSSPAVHRNQESTFIENRSSCFCLHMEHDQWAAVWTVRN